MNKRHLHHTWRRFRRVKPRYFLILAIISGVICVFALRANNQHMVELREAVYTADKNNGDTETALQDLRAYVTSHMNTNLSAGDNAVYPPIQLKYTYERLIQAKSAETSQQNQQIYTDAQRLCEQQDRGVGGGNRVPCIQQYVQSRTVVSPSDSVPDALYKFSFVTPKWSPDLAGWSMVATILLSISFIVSLIAHLWFKRQLR